MLKGCLGKKYHGKKQLESDEGNSPSNKTIIAICPNCGYQGRNTPAAATIARRASANIRTRPTSFSLPTGLNPSILLDNSPTPQILISNSNIIVYANRSATRLLGRNSLIDLGDPTFHPPPIIPTTRPTGGKSSFSSTGSQGIYEHDEGIEGFHLEDLPMDLARIDMRKWISLAQVLKTVKAKIRKQTQLDTYGYDSGAYSEFYDTGKKEDDYSGDNEIDNSEDSSRIDEYSRKEKIPIIITKQDGELLGGELYMSILETTNNPTNSGVFIALSIVPNSDDVDAEFNPALRGKSRKPSAKQSVAAGTTGTDVVDRVAKLKDMILDEMEYSFACITPDGDICITNKACRRVLGQDIMSPVGQGRDWISNLDVWRPDFSERLPYDEWCTNKVFITKLPQRATVGLLVDGEERVFDLKATPLWQDPEKKDNLLAGLTVIVEQTERANREQEISRSAEIRKVFLMNLSRGLKTRPVAGVISFLELLYEIQTGKEQRTLVRQIFRSVNSFLLVINDLIDFNKIESNDVKVDQNVFVLQHLVEDLETLFRNSMAKEGVEFKVDDTEVIYSAFGDGTQLLLKGDDAKVRRVVINLLSNAYKFTSKGTVSLKVITKKVQKGSLELRFEVKDTGIGISEDHLKKLFLPFEEIAAADISTGHYGTGFGLAIAKSFATILRGNIGCQSVVDQGSTFWFSVPCLRPPKNSPVTIPRREDSLAHDMGVVLRIGDLHSAIRHDYWKKQKVSIKGTNVLIVEDNWSHQVVTAKRMEKMGCNVQVAINGQNAISRMKKGELKALDIIFMDLQMPLLDGYETTAIIRKAEDPGLVAYKDVPIVAVTATEMAGDRDRAREAGMNDFTLKPLNNESLREIIERFLEKEAAKDFHEDFSVQSFLPRLNEIPQLSLGRTDSDTRNSQA
ncbi:uncharacterized protein LAJ45_01244 [Morchella importuna]|uniref:uncharacterized protein n=1 Tax=Morchella importuna TaxID=1174673 RepID=UPI001E8DCC86|nr:uncharacterized protein LAJ45_01244 [Morchella importuna]KAH8154713.1 hypothetical protein LAJ45_01244 [Morchella importuna]